MIISRIKPWEEILGLLDGAGQVALVGCGTCATYCQAGGEEEVLGARRALEGAGKTVTDSFVLESVCAVEKTKRELKRRKSPFQESDAVLVMACGVGVQTVAALVDKPVYPALDTLFIGSWRVRGPYQEMCSLCGECILGWTGGICPINRCSKGLLNGPCGGSRAGRCEVDEERDCGWLLIYQRLQGCGALGLLEEIREPRDASKDSHPQIWDPLKRGSKRK